MAAQREWIAKQQAALGPRLSAAESAAVRARQTCFTVHDEEPQSRSDEQDDRLRDDIAPWSTAADNYTAWWQTEGEAKVDHQGEDLNLDVPLDSEEDAADYEVDIDRRSSAGQPETAASINEEHDLDAYEEAVWSDAGPEDDVVSLSCDHQRYNSPYFPADAKRRHSSLCNHNTDKIADPSRIDLFAPDAPTLPAIRLAVRFVPRAAPTTRTLYVRESKVRCNALFANTLSQPSENADDGGTTSMFDKIMRRCGSRRHRTGNNSDEASDQNSEESGDELELEGSKKKHRHGKTSKAHSVSRSFRESRARP